MAWVLPSAFTCSASSMARSRSSSARRSRKSPALRASRIRSGRWLEAILRSRYCRLSRVRPSGPTICSSCGPVMVQCTVLSAKTTCTSDPRPMRSSSRLRSAWMRSSASADGGSSGSSATGGATLATASSLAGSVSSAPCSAFSTGRLREGRSSTGTGTTFSGPLMSASTGAAWAVSAAGAGSGGVILRLTRMCAFFLHRPKIPELPVSSTSMSRSSWPAPSSRHACSMTSAISLP